MKKLLILLAIGASILTVPAQPPQKMSYQCVVRDKDGALLTKQVVGMRTTILQGSDIQLVVYQETYNFTATNANGLLSIEIGSGKATIVSGSFSSIPWAAGPFFLQTEIDPTGGTNYTIVGKSQILSVPYALYAEKSGTVTENDRCLVPQRQKELHRLILQTGTVHTAGEIMLQKVMLWIHILILLLTLHWELFRQ